MAKRKQSKRVKIKAEPMNALGLPRVINPKSESELAALKRRKQGQVPPADSELLETIWEIVEMHDNNLRLEPAWRLIKIGNAMADIGRALVYVEADVARRVLKAVAVLKGIEL